MAKRLVLTVLMVVLTACGDSRGEALPRATPTRESVPLSDGRARVWPRSGQAEVGVRYAYDTGHCGLTYDLDFDGSFWEPVDEAGGRDPDFFINSDQGSMTLVSEQEAVYEASDGQTAELLRVEGPVVQPGCA